jgi:uncharacterized integral membrane protein
VTELSARAVLVGSLVDILGSFIVGALFFGVLGATSGVTSAEELARIYDTSLQLQVTTLALGLAMTGVGAYVAARIAKPGLERLHAFAVGVISTTMGFTIVFAAPESAPFWSQATSLILTIPAAFIGGEIRRALAGAGRRTS